MFGGFPFFRASTLGGKYNLRGHRSTRFTGRSSAFNNLDLRIGLFRFSTYAAVGEVGLLGFHDLGRVWTDGEESDVWHQAYLDNRQGFHAYWSKDLIHWSDAGEIYLPDPNAVLSPTSRQGDVAVCRL